MDRYIGVVTGNRPFSFTSKRTRTVRPLTGARGRSILDPPDRIPEIYLPDGQDLEEGQFIIYGGTQPSVGQVKAQYPDTIGSHQYQILNQELAWDLIPLTEEAFGRLVVEGGLLRLPSVPWRAWYPQQAICRVGDKLYGPFDMLDNEEPTEQHPERCLFYELGMDQIDNACQIVQLWLGEECYRSIVWVEDYQTLLDLLQHQGTPRFAMRWDVLAPSLDLYPTAEVTQLLQNRPNVRQQLVDHLTEIEIQPRLEELKKRELEVEAERQECASDLALAEQVMRLDEEHDEVRKHAHPLAEAYRFDNEVELLGHVDNYIRSRRYHFDSNLIANFWTCLKSDYLTILSGISGTGKSTLPWCFAEAIGAVACLIPVKPNWHDSRDFLGFYNAITAQYQTTPALDAVLAAARERDDRLWIIILDEMNLAPVEHYFADFLSLLEQRQGTAHLQLDGWDRNVWRQTLNYWHDKGDAARLSATKLLEPPVVIPDNVRFVGTVNIDHTTHAISDKVLDRANVIQFERADLEHDSLSLRQRWLAPGTEELEVPFRLEPTQFREFAHRGSFTEAHVTSVDPYMLKIKRVDALLGRIGHNIGYRVLDSIAQYLLHVARGGYLSLDCAFDFQIKQRVLPKLRGMVSTDDTLEVVLQDLAQLLREYPESYEKIAGRETEGDRYGGLLQQVPRGYLNYWDAR